MKKTILIALYVMVIGVTVIFQSCKKNDEKTNELPSSFTEFLIDTRDRQTYGIVDIGSQTWMAENLNYHANSWCYDDNLSNCEEYGRLYNWATIMNNEGSSDSVPSGVQGICPVGWHLPSDEEWRVLEIHLGMSQSESVDVHYRGTEEGKKLKNTTGWYSGGNGTNVAGFYAIPGGYHSKHGNFLDLGAKGDWWTATEYSSTLSWYRSLDFYHDEVYRYVSDKISGHSVRCLKD